MSSSSIITGVVIDANTKRSIADAVVTATSSSLQGEQTVVTDGSGSYRIPNLPAGSYTIQVEAETYKAYTRSGITLKVDQTLKINASLSPTEL